MLAPFVSFFCVIFVITGAHGASFFFNNSLITLCAEQGGCSILDKTIYDGGAAPGPSDDVYINVTTADNATLPLLFRLPNATFFAGSFYLAGNASLVLTNATFDVGNLLLSQGAVFQVDGNAFAYVEQDIKIEGGSQVHIYNFFSVEGAINSFLSNSSIFGYNGSVFQILGASFVVSGLLHFSEGSTYSALTTSSVYSYTQLSFPISPAFGAVEFLFVNATFSSGFDAVSVTLASSNLSVYSSFGDDFFAGFFIDAYSTVFLHNATGTIWNENSNSSFGLLGTGTYVISSSNLSVTLPNVTSAAKLIFAGTSNFVTNTLYLNPSLASFENTIYGQVPYVTFDLTGNGNINGDLEIPGEITIRSGSTVFLNGNISFSQGMHVESQAAFAQVQVAGSLTCGAPIFLDGYRDINTTAHSFFTAVNATITAPSITVSGDFLLQSVNTSSFVGDVINNGSLYIFGNNNNIIVQGNYHQLPNATYGAYNLTSPKTHAGLFVSGTAVVDGVLAFNTTETDKHTTFTFIVLVANQVNGTFVEKRFSGSDIESLTPSVRYNRISIEVTITPNPSDGHKTYLGLEWWAWAIIAGGVALLVLGLLVAFMVRRSKRAQYEIVRA